MCEICAKSSKPVKFSLAKIILTNLQARQNQSLKKSTKRGREPWLEIHKSLVRKYIETTIGEISKLFPKKIHATNLNGFLLKIALFLFAFQIDKAFIQ